MTPEDIPQAETILGRTLTPLELGICTQIRSLSLEDFLYAVGFQSLMVRLERDLDRKMTAAEALIAARLLRKGKPYEAILLAIKKPTSKIKLKI
jgi:hypothetical protein